MSPRASEKFKLLNLRVKPITLRSYERYLQEFIDWLPENKLTFKDWKELDERVVEFAVHTHEEAGGARRQVVIDVKQGLEHYFPEVLGKMILTKRSLEGWGKSRPVQQKAVCPRIVALGLGHKLMEMDRPEEGLAILLIFECYLRVGEVVKLSITDIRLKPPEERTKGNQGALMLKETKRGRNQSVLIRDPFIASLLERHIRNVKITNDSRRPNQDTKIHDKEPPKKKSRTTQARQEEENQPLFKFTQAQLNKQFKMAIKNLGVQELGLTPHSLRYGAASQDFIDGVLDLPGIKSRGRWRTDDMLQYYVQPGLVMDQEGKVAEPLKSRLRRLRDQQGRFFKIP